MIIEKHPTFESWIKDIRFTEIKELINIFEGTGFYIRDFMSFQISRKYFVILEFGSWRCEVTFKRINDDYLVFSYDELYPFDFNYWFGE